MAYALAGAPLAAYLVVLAGLFVFQRSLLYLPDPSRPAIGALAALGAREAVVPTADGLDLLAWYRPPPQGRPVIAYFHGNGGNIGYRTERFVRFAREGYGVLFLEYRGYGGNPGTPSQAGLYADAEAALRFLERERIGADQVVLYGESLGTAVAVHLAAERRVAAVVLESPFARLTEAAQYHYPFVPVALLLLDRFDPLSEIGRIEVPILFLHGGRDRVVPPRFGRALFDAAREPKEQWFEPDAGHGDLSHFGAFDAVFDFLRRRLG
jgi:fermentation-respiration switch protein FrsA (DUF1100 family)